MKFRLSLSEQWFCSRPSFVGIVLAPLSLVYWLLSRCHRGVYRVGLRSIYRASVPVFTVGNFIAGGAGKTPIVIALAKFFQNKGIKVAVISRGYGVEITGNSPVVVSPLGLDEQSLSDELPDEPYLIASSADVPVYCHPKKSIAAEYAVKEGAELLLVDDGLQHYALHSDKKILIHPPSANRYGNGWLLPVGPLRQLPSGITSIDYQLQDSRYLKNEKHIVAYQYAPVRFISVFDQSVSQDIDEFNGRKAAAFAAIAYPQRFSRQLSSIGVSVDYFVGYPDHHQLNRLEVHKWLSMDGVVMMTAKDAMKFKRSVLQYFPNEEIACDRFWFLEMSADLPQCFLKKLLMDFRALNQ